MNIKGFENYQVYPDGIIVGARGKVLKPDLNSVGYQRVSLSLNGKVTRVFIHRLVALHFVDNPNQHEYVNHKDGNRENNHYLNLEWVTASYNVKDGFNRGRATDHLARNFKRP